MNKQVTLWGDVKAGHGYTEACNFALGQNYPNPFNPDTWIPYQLKEDADVEIKIYTSTGQFVKILDLGLRWL